MNPLDDVSEAVFQVDVLQTAALHGWRHMHVPTTMLRGKHLTAATTGWPDLTLWRPGAFILRELKAEGQKLRPEQIEVLRSLHYAGVDVDVWRPHQTDEIYTALATMGRKTP